MQSGVVPAQSAGNASTSATSGSRKVIRGSILHFVCSPLECRSPEESFIYLPDGLLVIEQGHLADILPYTERDPLVHHVSHDYSGSLITPGFVDTHLHYPQTGVVASYGEQLLEWLSRYVFPAEAKFNQPDYARQQAEVCIRQMLRSGTTSAAVFATVFSQSVDAFFAQALSDNMRVLCGKVMMDRNVPPSLQESAEHSYQTSAQLIERWHGRGRLLYAVSPRFALTSSRTLLESAGRLLACYPDVYLHTHLSENREEVRQVRRLFPEAESYLALYHRYGLTGPRSLFAHSIYLDDTEWALMAESGSVALFCPSSNLFLGSGLFSMHKAKQYGVRVGLGSDIGAGNSFSLLYTLNEAYKVCQLQQYRLSALKGLYLATLGGARALSLDHLIGNFIPGKEADFVVWDWQATELQKIRHAYTNCLEEKLFALMMLGDERNVMATFIAGEQRYP